MADCPHGCMPFFETDPEVRAYGLGAAALRYQRQGYAVLALRRLSKRPHPLLPHGVLQATTDERMVRHVWGQDRLAGIGIACGPSRLIVIDLDIADGLEGWAQFESMREAWSLPLPEHPVSVTPSGGWHLWFRVPWGVPEVPSRIGILPAVDVKAGGGYIAVPPTRIMVDAIDGSRVRLPYRWARGCSCTVPYAPAWMTDWIMQTPGTGTGSGGG